MGWRGRKPKNCLAFTAPITVILVMTTMFLLTNILAVSSIVSISNFGNDDPIYRRYVISCVHETIEHIYSSNPGSSLTIILNLRSKLAFTQNSLVFEDIDGLELHDSCSIVSLVTPKEIVYDGSKVSFVPTSIPIGLSKATFYMNPVGGVKRIWIVVDRP